MSTTSTAVVLYRVSAWTTPAKLACLFVWYTSYHLSGKAFRFDLKIGVPRVSHSTDVLQFAPPRECR